MVVEMKCMDILEIVDVGSECKVVGVVIVKFVVNVICIFCYLSQNGVLECLVDIVCWFLINFSICFNILCILVMEDVVDFNLMLKCYLVGLGLVCLVG